MTTPATATREEANAAFDSMQANLSAVASSTDAELTRHKDAMDELFGEKRDPEARRQEARETQDKLDRQGREAFAEAYTRTQIKNYEN